VTVDDAVALVWRPLGQGLLTGRYRKGQQADTHRFGYMPQHSSDERMLDVVEALIPLAEKAGLPMTHHRAMTVLALSSALKSFPYKTAAVAAS
jgi:aryl-alcohol dehydrogenase-like predicted oxidoreductase